MSRSQPRNSDLQVESVGEFVDRESLELLVWLSKHLNEMKQAQASGYKIEYNTICPYYMDRLRIHHGWSTVKFSEWNGGVKGKDRRWESMRKNPYGNKDWDRLERKWKTEDVEGLRDVDLWFAEILGGMELLAKNREGAQKTCTRIEYEYVTAIQEKWSDCLVLFEDPDNQANNELLRYIGEKAYRTASLDQNIDRQNVLKERLIQRRKIGLPRHATWSELRGIYLRIGPMFLVSSSYWSGAHQGGGFADATN